MKPEPQKSPNSLDDLLAFDRVDPPAGLAERIIDRVRQEEPADELTPAPRPRWRPRLLLPVALPLVGAAAALTLILMRGGGSGSVADENRPAVEAVADLDVEVSDELLASLSVLENMDFLTEELDPFDADALFLFEAEDQVLMDLLVSEGYGPDGVLDAADGASDGSGERR